GGQLGGDDLVHQRNADAGVEDVDRQVGVNGLGHVGQAPFAAERMTTRAPLAPGTAPLTRMRPRSTSTAWTVRFCVVTVSVPMWPAMRRPLKTRPGVAQPPIEPGLRWLRCAPCEAETPAK